MTLRFDRCTEAYATRQARVTSVTCLMLLALVWLMPTPLFAQASITGVIRDASGAVLPGVTVEAASPVLIEKVRTVVSDGGGQYRIVDLRPGVYSVTFTLPGFSVVKREGIELTGTFVATVNADMRVGGLEETITVTGEAPIVDVQGTTQQRVMTQEVMDAIPASRFIGSLAVLIPGMSVASATSGISSQDVGGSGGDLQSSHSIHGGRGNEQVVMIGGNPSEWGPPMLAPNALAMEEVQIDTAGGDATTSAGGVRFNMIPRDGGNVFKGQVAFNGASEGMVGDNLSDRLRALGVTAVSPTKAIFDIGAGIGGPIMRDKLWFYGTGRYNLAEVYIASLYRNKNAKNPNAWAYEPNLSEQVFNSSRPRNLGVRLTWRVTEKNKIGFLYDDRHLCICPDLDLASPSLEAAPEQVNEPSDFYIGDWSAPLTNRLLLEAGALYLNQTWRWRPTEDYDPRLVGVVELVPSGIGGTSVSTYRARLIHQVNREPHGSSRFATSYVTGAHAFKVGLNHNWGTQAQLSEALGFPYTYTLNNGVPTQINLSAAPFHPQSKIKTDFGLYAQDRWTFRRLTLSGGLRYDYWNSYAPETHFGPAILLPNRNLTFPETPLIGWHDVTPRVSAAYDVFGSGKTAIKTTLNKYLALGTTRGIVAGTPANSVQNTASRAWVDNGNFVPDCDLVNPALQDNRASGGDLCGAFTGNNVLFGQPNQSVTFDRETRFGWGARPYNWEFSTSVQHQLTPRVGLDVGYFRRWFGNFTITDNLNLSATDFNTFSVKAPTDPRLPDGGGQTVTGFLNVTPAAATRTPNNVVRLTKHYGTQQEHFNGMDLSLNARLGGGTLFQGGFSTGRTSFDNCEVLAAVPEAQLGAPGGTTTIGQFTLQGPAGVGPFCRAETNWQSQFKALGSYTMPRLDILLSATVQSLPGPAVVANYTASAAEVEPSLGRPLSGSARTVTVNIIEPGSVYGDRLNQLDMRIGKIFRLSRTRSLVSFELYNLLNSDAVLRENQAFGVAWRRPSAVVSPRMWKVSAQLDF